MVFEKTPKRECEVCNGHHNEEHGAYKLEQASVQLTGTGKVLPAIALGATLITIFFYTISYADINFLPKPDFSPLSQLVIYLNDLFP
ncbi:MAG: hypothetical protein HY517_04070 [Candidatus Aenigmarchaeota archaeon]|nr:hypothetical protein [Candidatus Aenigmarchaeota archaeon]